MYLNLDFSFIGKYTVHNTIFLLCTYIHPLCMVWLGPLEGGYFRYSEDKFVILFLESILLHLLCIPYMYTYNKNIILDFCLVNNDHTLK